MLYEIKNDYITVKADTFGAEMHSLQHDGVEYLWQCGDSWKRYAPILFPFICSPKNRQYLVDGKQYTMKANHGFARDMEFHLLRHTDDEITFELHSNGETLAQYPFQFSFEVTYHLLSNGVEVRHVVKNAGSTPMYFYLGGHPAFNCPIDGDGVFSDYDVIYELPEHLTHQNGSDVKEVEDGKIMHLKRELFDNDSIILAEPHSKSIMLCSLKTEHSVTVEFPESDCITVWSPTNDDRAAFVCLEPWTSVPIDFDDAEPELLRKPHALKLEAGNSYNYLYRILVK